MKYFHKHQNLRRKTRIKPMNQRKQRRKERRQGQQHRQQQGRRDGGDCGGVVMFLGEEESVSVIPQVLLLINNQS